MIQKAFNSIVLLACVLLIATFAAGQNTPITTDILGVHDLSSGTSPLHGANANACIYCHAPHNASSSTPLWNQRLSTQTYLLNPGTTGGGTSQVAVSPSSMLCLSCHDGSVAIGQTIGIGTLKMIGALSDNMGTKLQGSHPFSIQPQLKDAPSLVSTLVASHTTKDPAVSLIGNNVECSTCHDVHNQYKDLRNRKFLVRDNTTSALCFACHDVGARTVGGRDNPLTAWPNSAHAKSTAVVAPKAGLGSYSTIAEYACSTCHTSHGALSTSLLRDNPNRSTIPAADNTSQSCFTCHDGSDNMAVAILNVQADMQTGQIAHPFADTNNQHTASEPVVLDRNRHTTCADCHASHASQPTTAFLGTPNLRPSQTGVPGVSATGTVTKTATYQYENCLRCHATSVDKTAPTAYGYMPARGMFTGDTLDVSLQFAHGATSSHPVMRDATNLARPSLLKNMWDLTFKIQSRAMSSRILCTDCHNSDKNREFGGLGPNGPHGSKNEHILERQYIISKVAAGALPGTNIVNLNPSPVLTASPTSPYALCAKCHDLVNIASNVTFSQHSRHINDGFSCSVCHSAHGVPAGTTGVTGVGLVSFDLNVVAKFKNTNKLSYNGGGSCTLTCHGHDHNK